MALQKRVSSGTRGESTLGFQRRSDEFFSTLHLHPRLHDSPDMQQPLPVFLQLHVLVPRVRLRKLRQMDAGRFTLLLGNALPDFFSRSEEHTSELQSPCNLVCRLLLEKKKQITQI